MLGTVSIQLSRGIWRTRPEVGDAKGEGDRMEHVLRATMRLEDWWRLMMGSTRPRGTASFHFNWQPRDAQVV